MPEPLVIVGCGGHGREIYGIIRAVNEADGEQWKVLGFVDDAPSHINAGRLDRIGAPFLGAVCELAALPPECRYVIGIGDPQVRARVAAGIGLGRMAAAPLIHPDATVGLDNRLAVGVVIFAGARVTTNVRLGRHVHVNQNATVGHDTVLDDCVQVNPLAAVSGDCYVGEQTLIGTNAAVLQGLTIGEGARVGAGACVVRPVPAGATVKGVPAR